MNRFQFFAWNSALLLLCPAITAQAGEIHDAIHKGHAHASDVTSQSIFDELTVQAALDGSKQPQDFGVNATAGLQFGANWGLPLWSEYGIGWQIGTSITGSENAVRVYELIGETTKRTQSFTTVGVFQRCDRFAWGFAHDFLYEDYYDTFNLGQWRTRLSYQLTSHDEVGLTGMLQSYGDDGVFGAGTNVRLTPVDQLNAYWRRFWGTGAQTTFWIGMADGHGEDNAVTGFAPPKDDTMLVGADILMPLTHSLAIYGESNLIMPVDTGTVDAFLGIQWYPTGRSFHARRGAFSPLLPLASPVSFAVDLFRL